MKILVLQTSEPYPEGNNKLWRTGRLVESLVNDNNSVTWVGINFNHQEKRYVTKLKFMDNLKFVLYNSYNYKNNISIYRFLNYKISAIKFLIHFLFSKERFNLILGNIPNYDLAFAGTIYSKIRKVPMVIDYRDPWPFNFSIYAKKYYKYLLFEHIFSYLALKFSRRIILSTIENKKYLFKYNLHNKYSYLPISYNYVKKNFITRKDIIFAGTFGDSIDYPYMVKVINKLACTFPKSNIYLAGDGENKDWIKKLKSKSNILLLGWVDNVMMRELLSKSIFGLCFYKKLSSQGITNKMIEYISNGIIPLCNSNKIDYQILTKDDIIINKSCDLEIISRVEELLSNENELSKTSKRIIKYGYDNFSDEVVFKKYKKILTFHAKQ